MRKARKGKHMNKKILTSLAAVSLAFYLGACGDDNSSSAGPNVECLDNENCLDDASSDSNDAKSSSSVKKDEKSSSSEKKAESSSSESKEDKSSSSEKKDESSSSEASKDVSSSSEASSEAESSSSEASEEPESSSSVELKVTFLSETPNAADLEVSGDTLFAVFQRTYTGDDFNMKYDDNGLLAIYNLNDGTLLDTITLATKNPQAVKMVKGSLYVATLGEFNTVTWGTDADENRGIEKIDLKNKKSELWVSGTALGGGIYMMETNPKDGKAYTVINKGYDANFNADMPVMEVDLASKTVKSVGKIYDGSGSMFYDAKSNLMYIGERGFIDWSTYDMGPMVAYSYDGTALTALYDAEMGYQPAGIAVVDGEVFVYISDYSNAGKLYWIEDGDLSEESIQFSTDTKIVVVNGSLYVMDRKNAGSISKVNASAKSVEWQKAINAENPYDIVAIDGSTAWVAMYNTAEIRKISLTDGSTISSIDTKEFSAKKVEEVTDAE